MVGPASLSHLFVHVRDLPEARRFYVDRLGLELLVEEPGYIRIGGGDGFHIGMEEVPDEVGAAGVEIVVAVADVDEDYARLRAEGVEFESEPQDMPWGARHAWLRDPSGYRLSIFSGRRDAD
jgi:catechol 2,3-dioxygenase-like lactoylglutathione lyase family enzyme